MAMHRASSWTAIRCVAVNSNERTRPASISLDRASIAELESAAHTLREVFATGGRLFAFGNGGSATDAMDVVADFRAAPQGWPLRAAVDLTEDSAILTALANAIGPHVSSSGS